MRIRVIDIETTGMEPPAAAVCEIGYCDLFQIEAGAPWKVCRPTSILIDPGHPIPPEVSAIHHLVDEDVAGKCSLEFVTPDVLSHPDIDVLCAHNAKFERLFITDEMTGGKPWICTYKCALRIWKDAPSHSNQALRYWRKPEGLDRAIASVAHRAGPDAYVTAFLLRDMLNGGALVDHLIKRSSQPALQVRCHLGKERGKLWSDVEPGFLKWVLDKDFDEDVKFTARYWLEERAKGTSSTTQRETQ